MAKKKAKEESAKKTNKAAPNKKLKRTILGTLSGVCMASALIIAAIPVKESTAADPSAPIGTWTEEYNAKPDYNDYAAGDTRLDGAIPDYSSTSPAYYDKDGVFGFVSVIRTGSAETTGVLVYYDNGNSNASSHLVIPDEVECFLYNSSYNYKRQAVNSSGDFLYYVSKEAEYITDVSGNTILSSPEEYSPCLDSDYEEWSGKSVYTRSGTDYSASEVFTVKIRYIGSSRYLVDNAYSLTPAEDKRGVFEDATKFTSAVIPDHILAIGNNAFKGCTNLDSVTFSNQLNVIGNHAFDGCSRLTTVNFDNSSGELKQIGAYAFANCIYIKSVSIPGSVVQIGSGCFMNCTGMTAINLYGSNQDGNADLTHIGDGVFYNCKNLEQLLLPNKLDSKNVSDMTHLAYGCTLLKTLGLPTCGESGDIPYDFTYTNVTNCSSLNYVIVPNRNVRFDCNFAPAASSKNGYKHASESIPDTIIHHADHCTFGAENLGSYAPFNDFAVDDSFTIITYRNSSAYTYACEHEYSVGYFDTGYEGQYERVKNNYFFTVDSNNVLTKFGLYKENEDASIVEIPDTVGSYSVKEIDSNTFSTFKYNTQIKYVYIPTSVETIGGHAFEGCVNLQAVEFGNALNVRTIGDGAFKTMTEEDIPLRFIGTVSPDSEPFKYAMKPENNYNSTKATTKYISYTSDFPNNLQIELVVEKDPVTQTVTKAVPTLISAPSYEQFSDSLGSHPYSLLHDIYDSVSGNGIANRAYEEDKLVQSAYVKYQNGNDLTEEETAVMNAVLRATVPSGVMGINADVYQNRDYLTSVVLNTISDIPDEAFKNCTKLETFIMRSSGAEGGESIGNHVFDGDIQLTDLSLPSTLKQMGDLPFWNCTGLTDVDFGNNPVFSCENAIVYETNDDGTKTIVECLKQRGNAVGAGKIKEDEFNNVTAIRPSAFRGCEGVSQVYFGHADIQEIPEFCFADCTKLNYCEISDATESIGDYAFLNTALSDILIPSSVVLIPETAFTKGEVDNYELMKGLSIQCEQPSAAYTYAKKYGFSTEKREKKIWDVQFYDYYEKQIGETQKITEGEDAVPPAVPSDEVPEEIDGLVFLGWKGDYTNISGNTNIYANYGSGDKETFKVTFYKYPSWYEGSDKEAIITTRIVKSGTAAVDPPTDMAGTVDGYSFKGYWLPIHDNVTEDMKVYPEYEKKSSDAADDPGDSGSSSSDNNNDKNNNGNDNSNPGDNSGGDNGTGSSGGDNNGSGSGTGTTVNPNGSGSGTSSSSKPGSSSSGSVSQNKTTSKNNGTSVVVTKPGISNSDLISAIVNGSTDDFVLKIADSDSAKAAVEQALLNEYGSLDDIRYFAMDISLYDKTGTSKLQNLDGVSVTITMPIPDALTSYGGNNKAGAVINGTTLEKLDAKFTTINGVPCISFVARHFSPYTIYVDLNNLTASINGSDMTPKTGDPIHPKWFLSIGLALISIVLFCVKGSNKKVVKVIA